MMTGVRPPGLRRLAARVTVGVYSRRGKVQTDKREGGTEVYQGRGTDPSSRFRGSTCSGVQEPECGAEAAEVAAAGVDVAQHGRGRLSSQYAGHFVYMSTHVYSRAMPCVQQKKAKGRGGRSIERPVGLKTRGGISKRGRRRWVGSCKAHAPKAAAKAGQLRKAELASSSHRTITVADHACTCVSGIMSPGRRIAAMMMYSPVRSSRQPAPPCVAPAPGHLPHTSTGTRRGYSCKSGSAALCIARRGTHTDGGGIDLESARRPSAGAVAARSD
jgi:hypothetical protein